MRAAVMSLAALPRTLALPRVWIVDDSALEAELVRRALLALCRVELFTDAASVLEHSASAEPPDAIILDWEMPGISGVEVCRFLRTQPSTQATPILLLTVHNETRDLVEGLSVGADDFLTKPYKPAELAARVTTLVRGKRMRDRVERAEREYRALLIQAPDAVLIVNPAGAISFANFEAERMFRRSMAALAGMQLSGVVPELAGALAHGATAADDQRRMPDVLVGDRVFSPAVRTHAGLEACDTMVTFRDVTASRRLDAERAALFAREQTARAAAEDANRAKDDFLAVVSHELRTPLNAILGWTRMLLGGSVKEEKKPQVLETIERNASAQAKLIEEILDVSRIISGKMELRPALCDVALVIRAATDASRPAALAKGIRVEERLSSDLGSVVADPDRLQQIVGNLLNNSVKFTPAGGLVTVDASRSGDLVEIRVTDTGEGIAPGFLPRVFDRFRQADAATTRAHGGLGLGLSIVRHLTELHGGTVEGRSDGKGRGAMFIVRLPTERLAAAIPASPPPMVGELPVHGPSSLEGIRILVVDDDRDTRDLLTSALRSAGADVMSVSCAAEALAALESSRHHVVLSDIAMPEQDGYALIRSVRELPAARGGTIPAIAVTAFAADHDRARALSSGFDAWAAKPIDLPRLVNLVATLVYVRTREECLA